MNIAIFILTLISTTVAVIGVINKDKIKLLFDNKAKNKNTENDNKISAEKQEVSILIELKETVNLYRATKKNNSYLMLNTMLLNTSNDIIVIRGIEAIMSDEIGVFCQKSVSVHATHLGSGAMTYSMGTTQNLLPLSLTGNSSIDAYLLFEFPNTNIEIGNVQIKLISSKGNLLIPLSVDIIG